MESIFTQSQLVDMLLERIKWQSELLNCKKTHINKLMGGWGYSTNAEYYTIEKVQKWKSDKKLSTLTSAELVKAIKWLDWVRENTLQ